MKAKEAKDIERIIVTNNFLSENQTEVSVNAIVNKNIPLLGEQVGVLETYREKQIASDGSVREYYGNAEDIFKKLHAVMSDVSAFAVTISADVGDITERFKIPPGSSKRKYISTARVFADHAATTLEAKFVEAGMETNFIQTLTTLALALEKTLTSAITAKQERIGATGSLPVAIRESNRIIKIIDPCIRKIFKDNPIKLTAWESAAHRQRDPKPKKAAAKTAKPEEKKPDEK